MPGRCGIPLTGRAAGEVGAGCGPGGGDTRVKFVRLVFLIHGGYLPLPFSFATWLGWDSRGLRFCCFFGGVYIGQVETGILLMLMVDS